MNTTKSMRIGVSGLGSIGCRHARLLAAMPGVEAVGFDQFGVSEAAAAIGDGLTIAPSFEALLEMAPDGLIVATPDSAHVDQALAAVAARIPVLVEKPLSDDIAAARRLVATATAAGVPGLVGYVLRHTDTIRRLQRAVERGTVGVPVSVSATLSAYETLVVARNRFSDDDRFRLLYDYSHEWDYLQWIFGPVRSVAGTSWTVPNIQPTQTPNVVEALLDFDSGMTGAVHLDYVGSGRSCRVIGDEGVISADVSTGTVVVQRSGADELREVVHEERDVSFVRQLEHFLAVARGEVEPVVSLTDGVNAVAVADALVTACTERRWVNLSD